MLHAWVNTENKKAAIKPPNSLLFMWTLGPVITPESNYKSGACDKPSR